MHPGDCIGVDAYLRVIRHLGVVTDAVGDDGRFRVISASQRNRGVVEEDYTAFAGAKPTFLVLWYSQYPVEETLERCRARIGQPYNHTRYNCEHFVRECFGLTAGSPQARRFGWVVGGITTAAAAGVALFIGSRK